jgi:hypothetical protein
MQAKYWEILAAVIVVLLSLVIAYVYYLYTECVFLGAYAIPAIPSGTTATSCPIPAPTSGSALTASAPSLGAYAARYTPVVKGTSYTAKPATSSGSSSTTPTALYLTVFKTADALTVVNTANALCPIPTTATSLTQAQVNCAYANSYFGSFVAPSGSTTAVATPTSTAPSVVGVFTTTAGGTTADPNMPLIVDLSAAGVMHASDYAALTPVSLSSS